MTATFDDGKDEGALRTIGEVGKALGLKPHVLRYWEEQFPTLDPLKRSGNRRYYRPEDVALIETIDRLVNHEGYTLKGARQAIEEGRAEISAVASKKADLAERPELPERDAAETLDAELLPAPVSEAVTAARSSRPPAVAADILAELKDIRKNLAAAVGA